MEHKIGEKRIETRFGKRRVQIPKPQKESYDRT